MGDETCGAACRGGDCDIGASDGKVDTAASASSPGTSAFVPTCRLECALNHWASVRCAMGVTAATLAALLTAARYGALQALVAHGILLWFALRAVGLGTGFLARRAGVARGVRASALGQSDPSHRKREPPGKICASDVTKLPTQSTLTCHPYFPHPHRKYLRQPERMLRTRASNPFPSNRVHRPAAQVHLPQYRPRRHG